MDDLLQILIENITLNKKHANYATVCELADSYRRVITNKDTDVLFEQVTGRESGEWFAQRKRLTQLILKPMAAHLLAPERKVARSNDLHKEIKVGSDSTGAKVEEFEKILNHFYGEKSLENYMRNRFMRLTQVDPNSWIVIEWPSVLAPQATHVQPYPFEVKAEQAINFHYENYVLQWLLVDLPSGMLHKYTIYGKDNTVSMQEFNNIKDVDKEGNKILFINIPDDGRIVEIDGKKYVCLNQIRYFEIQEPPYHKLGYVPAMRTGYHTDASTDDLTYVNTFDAAMPYILGTVKAKSEFDLMVALHVFAIRLQYVPPCPKCQGAGTEVDGTICGTCHGERHIPTTTQDVITFPLPKPNDEMRDLSAMLKYVSPPSEIIDVMVANLDKLQDKAFQTVWGREAFSKTEIAGNVTATQLNVTESSKYDNLFALAEQMCHFYTFAARTIAKATSMNDVVVSMSVGKEFTIKSSEELAVDYKSQKDAGMSADIYNKTMRDMARVMYSNEPELMRKFDVRMQFRPFSDKTPDQITVILTQKSETTINDRVLWINYEAIWDGLEMADENIYDKPKKDIRKALDAAVNDMIAKIKAEQPATPPVDFNNPA